MSKKQTQTLQPKDLNNFRQALKLYESKQYKKALKTTDLVLKKNPEHGETLAIKGLVLYFMEKKEEGHDYIKKGLSKNLESHISWHIHGIYHKQERNYEESAKCFTKASQIDKQNQNILRDLAQLLAQTRQFSALAHTRQKILSEMIGVRMNWNGLAVGQFLSGDMEAAEKTLSDFEDMLKEPLPKSDTENSEMILFKNYVIYKQGDVQRALDHLESVKDTVLDKLAVLECRAKYLHELGRLKESEKEFRALIKRNPECVSYYLALEEVLGIKEDNLALRKVYYDRFAAKYPKADAPRSIPLEFLTGDAFKQAVGDYLKGKLSRGVPSTFVLVKPLYNDDSKKQIIHDFINEYYSLQKNATTTDPSTQLWTIYYMAQHYTHLGEYETGLEYIDEAIRHTPTLVELYMTKAKILKHMGDIETACDVMNEARELDLQDRFVNTKAVKYMLRAGRMEKAIETLSLFTRNDANGKGVQDLHDMQSITFLIEQAESYARSNETLGLALKRFHAVAKVFDEYFNDQYDFHYYCPRKGTLRAYLDMLSWEDSLYTHPLYIRAVAGAAKIYFKLADDLEKPSELDQMDEAERKKLLKKQKKERAKEFKKEQDVKSKSSDPDPLGKQLAATKEPLEDVAKLFAPISDQKSTDSALAWQVGCELYLRQHKYPLAVQALVKAKKAGGSQSWITANAIRVKDALDRDEEISAALKAVPMMTLPTVLPKENAGDIADEDLNQYADKHVIDETDPRSVIDYAKVKVDLASAGVEVAERPKIPSEVFEKLTSILKYSKVSFEDAKEALSLLESWKFDGLESFKEQLKAKWPRSTV